jgi:large subunit ribosomal protein L22
MEVTVAKVRDFVRKRTVGEHIWRVGVKISSDMAKVTLYTPDKPESFTLERAKGKLSIADTLGKQLEATFGRKFEVAVVQVPTAVARFIRISPRKCRHVVDAIRYKHVDDALAILQFVPNAAARVVAKLVKSAVANAENNHRMDRESLEIIHVHVDEGPTLKRISARAMGRVYRIAKRTSHITIGLGETESEPKIGRHAKGVARVVGKSTKRGAKSEAPKKERARKKSEATAKVEEKPMVTTEQSESPQETGGGEQ